MNKQCMVNSSKPLLLLQLFCLNILNIHSMDSTRAPCMDKVKNPEFIPQLFACQRIAAQNQAEKKEQVIKQYLRAEEIYNDAFCRGILHTSQSRHLYAANSENFESHWSSINHKTTFNALCIHKITKQEALCALKKTKSHFQTSQEQRWWKIGRRALGTFLGFLLTGYGFYELFTNASMQEKAGGTFASLIGAGITGICLESFSTQYEKLNNECRNIRTCSSAIDHVSSIIDGLKESYE